MWMKYRFDSIHARSIFHDTVKKHLAYTWHLHDYKTPHACKLIAASPRKTHIWGFDFILVGMKSWGRWSGKAQVQQMDKKRAHTQDLETEGMSWKQKVPQMSGSFACQCLKKVSAREIQMQSFTEWTDTHLQWAVKHQTLQVRLVGKLLHKRTESEGSRVSLARSLVGS